MSKSTTNVLTVAVLMTALTGCAQNVWVKPGGNPQAFEAEKYACERDARQSGGFGGGLVGAMEFQAFFNRCMGSKGWALQNKEQAEAQIASQNSSLSMAQSQHKSCVANLRAEPRFTTISGRLADMNAGKFTFAQMASADVPSPTEAVVLADYFTASEGCWAPMQAVLFPMVSEQQRQLMLQRRSDGDAVNAQLVRRQISYGDWATRSNQLTDATKARFQGGS
ncbi:hypothetical protein [Roseomonas marmotae]|uniref:Lipoprotein n=1 Tax=Roseomonas marmotae TaxID=2768161 RepID=A0ABS3KIM1_9PROT|nr:hypothetical protein [Roseomonas marmotae]MBO1077277.1 hypothetical protein [Roseomonas marmotae]